MIKCALCMRSEVQAAGTLEIGYWAIVPSDQKTAIYPTCCDCAFHHFVCGIDEFGNLLECSGKDLTRQVPDIRYRDVDLVLTVESFHFSSKICNETGA